MVTTELVIRYRIKKLTHRVVANRLRGILESVRID